MSRLKDKVAIITGSASGIGKAIAELFGKEGAKVVVADFNEEGLNSTVNELESKGIESLGVKVDVTNEADISKMVEETVEKFGTVDILVNNAEIGRAHV